MEGALSATGTTLLSISKTLRYSTAAGQTFRSQFRRNKTTATAFFHKSSGKLGTKSPLWNAGAAVSPAWYLGKCFSSSGACFSSPSGGDSGAGGGEGADDVSFLPSDVIILDVKGMMCGGCASSVKRILENQSQVSSASVNHTTETAIVWPISEAKVSPNWQKIIGQELAKNLTNSGFDSNLRGMKTCFNYVVL